MVPAQTETTWRSTGNGLYWRLLEQLDQPRAAVQLGAGGRVQVGGEGGERLQVAVLRQGQLEAAGDLPHGLDLGVAADPGDRLADVDGRADTGVEQVGLQEDLAVGDRDDVRRDVGRDVVGLGLDDRQPGQRPAAQVLGQLGAALQQPRVQVEDVAGVGLAARRAAQQQRDGAVGLGLLGQVVEDDQDVLAVRTSSAGRWPSRCRGRCTCSRPGRRPGPTTIVVYSSAPASSSDWRTWAIVEPFWPMAT